MNQAALEMKAFLEIKLMLMPEETLTKVLK